MFLMSRSDHLFVRLAVFCAGAAAVRFAGASCFPPCIRVKAGLFTVLSIMLASFLLRVQDAVKIRSGLIRSPLLRFLWSTYVYLPELLKIA
jgi:hypothetical protein